MSADGFDWPASRAAIKRLQSERKRLAVERALAAPFYRKRLARINLDRLDEPEVWNAKIGRAHV